MFMDFGNEPMNRQSLAARSAMKQIFGLKKSWKTDLPPNLSKVDIENGQHPVPFKTPYPGYKLLECKAPLVLLIKVARHLKNKRSEFRAFYDMVKELKVVRDFDVFFILGQPSSKEKEWSLQFSFRNPYLPVYVSNNMTSLYRKTYPK